VAAKRRHLIPLVLAFVLGPGSLSAAQETKLEAVTLAVPTVSLTFTTDYVAEDLGLFARHGIAVKTIEISGVGTLNAVISGSTDFGQTSAVSLTRAAARGQRMIAFIETIDRPVVQIVLRRELAAAAGFDAAAPLARRALVLRGHTIAVEGINSIVHAYLRLVARRADYDPEEIRIAVMQPDNMIAAFAAGQIDGFAMSPPWPQKPVLEGSAVMIASGPDGDPADMWPFASSIVVTRPETCKTRRSTCEAMGQAFAEAVAFMHAHPAETLALMKKRFAMLDENLLAAALAAIVKISPSPPAPTKAGMENAELFNIDAGLLRPAEKLKAYDDLYTDAFVR